MEEPDGGNLLVRIWRGPQGGDVLGLLYKPQPFGRLGDAPLVRLQIATRSVLTVNRRHHQRE
jgi:hypothetical protein